MENNLKMKFEGLINDIKYDDIEAYNKALNEVIEKGEPYCAHSRMIACTGNLELPEWSSEKKLESTGKELESTEKNLESTGKELESTEKNLESTGKEPNYEFDRTIDMIPGFNAGRIDNSYLQNKVPLALISLENKNRLIDNLKKMPYNEVCAYHDCLDEILDQIDQDGEDLQRSLNKLRQMVNSDEVTCGPLCGLKESLESEETKLEGLLKRNHDWDKFYNTLFDKTQEIINNHTEDKLPSSSRKRSNAVYSKGVSDAARRLFDELFDFPISHSWALF